jgi:hypothetical protein
VLPLFHWEAEQRHRSKVPPAAGVMLKREELALLKAISSVQGNPAKTSCVALSKRHATITGARSVPPSSPRKGPQPTTGKRKAESSGSDGLTTPAARRTAPDTTVQPAASRHGR